MSVASALAHGRRAHLQLMRDHGTVARTGERTWNPETGKYEYPEVPIYTGPCRVKPVQIAHDVQAGERQIVLRQYDVRFPWDTAPEFRVDDVLTLSVSDDAWLIGRPLHVVGVVYQGTSTARHVMCEDRT